MNCRFFRRSNFLTIRDVMVPAYSAYVISQEAPDVKLILYPDAGHAFLFQGLRGIEWAILEVENARKLGIARRFCILAELRIRHE